MPNLLTLNETAREIRISRSQLNRIMAGRYPSLPPFPRIAIGSRIFVRHEALQSWLLIVERQEREMAYASGFSTHYLDEDMELIAGA